jgi:hypothetical protein
MVNISPSDAAYMINIPRELACKMTRANSFPYAKKNTNRMPDIKEKVSVCEYDNRHLVNVWS